MAANEVAIVNMSLNRIGETTITAAQLEAATETIPYYCSLHYSQTRDALLRSHSVSYTHLTLPTTPYV